MRLTQDQIDSILRITHQQVGEEAQVRVYGSRLDEQRRGGDLDLVIESPQHIDLMARADLKMALEKALQLPVDVLIYEQGKKPTAFQAIALSKSVLLDDAA